jgi:hypothetical protein
VLEVVTLAFDATGAGRVADALGSRYAKGCDERGVGFLVVKPGIVVLDEHFDARGAVALGELLEDVVRFVKHPHLLRIANFTPAGQGKTGIPTPQNRGGFSTETGTIACDGGVP